MSQPQILVNGGQSTELWPMRGGYAYPRYSAVEWPAFSTTTLNPVTSEPWRLLYSYHEISLACDGVRDTEVCCRLGVVPPSPSTAARTLWTQHATASAFSSLGGTDHGLRYRLARVNGVGIHRDPGNCRPFDQNGNLPPLQKGYWLPRPSTNVFRTRDLLTQCTSQYHH